MPIRFEYDIDPREDDAHALLRKPVTDYELIYTYITVLNVNLSIVLITTSCYTRAIAKQGGRWGASKETSEQLEKRTENIQNTRIEEGGIGYMTRGNAESHHVQWTRSG